MKPAHAFVVVLSAVIFGVEEDAPYVVVVKGAGGDGLPFGPCDPEGDEKLEQQLRNLVQAQTGFDPPYSEQLYTFGDGGRDIPLADLGGDPRAARMLSIGYMALTPSRARLRDAVWRSWYEFFPWEDWREGRPAALDAEIAPRLKAWADSADDPREAAERWTRARLEFALEGAVWNEERTLNRYELLYGAGLAPEAARDAGRLSGAPNPPLGDLPACFGKAMVSDHRRILATGLSRYRAKIKYRPVLFEVAPPDFTLRRLQALVESITGLRLHASNFRRLLTNTGLVEKTNQIDRASGGRPAMLYRVVRTRLSERPVGGIHVPIPRSDAAPEEKPAGAPSKGGRKGRAGR